MTTASRIYGDEEERSQVRDIKKYEICGPAKFISFECPRALERYEFND